MQHLMKSKSRGGRPDATLLVALALTLATIPSPGHSNILVRDLWAPDGEVRAIAQTNNTLYLGGSFSRVGPVSGSAVALDLVTAVGQAPFPKVDGRVSAVEPDGSGGWYIGGLFKTVQGQRRINLAQIDASGQVTSWSPRVDGEVLDIAVTGGVVYVVGGFNTVGTLWGGEAIQRWGAAAFNAATGVPMLWNPDPDAFPTEVEVGGGKVYLAGPFTIIYFDTSQQPRPCLAEFNQVIPGNASSGALTGLFAGSDPTLTDIEALELSGGKLFFHCRYTTNPRVRVYDLATGSFFAHDIFVGPPGHVYDVAVDEANGRFFIGGEFAGAGSQPVSNLAAVSFATEEVILAWMVPTNGAVRTLAVAPNGLLVGGEFSSVIFTPRRGLALVDPVGSNVFSWDPGCGGNVRAVEADGSRALVGGEFTIINSVPRSNLAALDETSGAVLEWTPSTNATVEALMVSGSTLYVGGQFTNVNGTTRNYAAAVDAATGALTAFNPNTDGPVKTFAISGTTLYLGGTFTTVRLIDRTGIAAVNASTGGVLAWNPGSDGFVNSITYLPGGIFSGPILIVGGEFTAIGGQFQRYVAILDPATATAGSLNSPDGPVHSMFVEPLPPGYGGYNEIFMGGDFTSVVGQPRNHIASLAAFGAVTSWNPNANGNVESIYKVGSTIFAGGAFTVIGGQNRAGIAALDVSGSAAPWNPGTPPPGFPADIVYSLLERAGTLYAGGAFTSIAGTPHGHFAGLGQVVTAVQSESVPGVTPIALRAAPNPFEQSTKIQFSLPTAGEARIAVYDVAGRRVREIHTGWLPAGRHTMGWDGREESGEPVAAGVYFVGVKTRTGSWGSKVYRLK